MIASNNNNLTNHSDPKQLVKVFPIGKADATIVIPVKNEESSILFVLQNMAMARVSAILKRMEHRITEHLETKGSN